MGKKKVNKKKRCSLEGCKKKLQLTKKPCRCGIIFCNYHRLPEQHNCKHDFKEGREDILIKNGLGGGKFNKIIII